MSDEEPNPPSERVISSEAELRTAIAEKFWANVNTGDNAANDELVAQLSEWHRKNRRHR